MFQSKNEDGSTAGLLIDAIQTPSMQEARNTNQTAFALLKSIDGTPSLVKIFDLPNNKQVNTSRYFLNFLFSSNDIYIFCVCVKLLVSATSEDLAESARKSALGDPSCKPSQVKVCIKLTAKLLPAVLTNFHFIYRLQLLQPFRSRWTKKVS